MKAGLATSVAAHVIALGWGMVVLSSPAQFDATLNEPLPVTVPIEDEMSVQKGSLSASQENKAAEAPTTKQDEDKPDAKNVGEGKVDVKAPLKPKERPREVETSQPKAGDPDAKTPIVPPDNPQKSDDQEQVDKPEEQPAPEKPKEPVKEPVETQAPSEKPADTAESVVPDPTIPALPDQAPVPMAKPQQVADKTERAPTEKPKEKSQSAKGEKDELSEMINDALLNNNAKTQGGGAKRSQGPEGFGASQNIGEQNRLAQTFANIVASCVHSKFNVLALGGGAQSDLKIKAHFYLNVDGSLVGTPEVSTTGGDNREQAVAMNQAYAALANCSPFPLPADKYNMWKEIEMVFDPYEKSRVGSQR